MVATCGFGQGSLSVHGERLESAGITSVSVCRSHVRLPSHYLLSFQLPVLPSVAYSSPRSSDIPVS